MNAQERLEAFLETDPRDLGCDDAMAVLHVYVELVADDPAAGAERFPGVAAHLAACGPCHDDFIGLLAAITSAD